MIKTLPSAENSREWSGHSIRLSRPAAVLQGQDTSSEAVANLRAAVQEGKDCSVEILNYRKNGEIRCVQSDWQWLKVRSRVQQCAGCVWHAPLRSLVWRTAAGGSCACIAR